MIKLLPPKYVKKANSWLVTKITAGDKGKQVHKQEWFGTYQEADEYYQELKEKEV